MRSAGPATPQPPVYVPSSQVTESWPRAYSYYPIGRATSHSVAQTGSEVSFRDRQMAIPTPGHSVIPTRELEADPNHDHH